MKTICIVYGFCEGERVGERLRDALETAGYKIVPDPRRAEVIIAHSGGCFLLPQKLAAKRIIFVNPPYWPGRGLANSLWHRFVIDLRSHQQNNAMRFWLHKTFWNSLYFWKMSANIRMLREREGSAWQRFGPIVTVIRNAQDTVCTPNVRSLPFTSPPEVIELPGTHDDLWYNPAPYVAVVQSEYGTGLLATTRGREAVVSGAGMEPAREPHSSR